MSLPLPLGEKIRVDRRDESLFFFWKFLPGEIHTFTARAFSSFFQFLLLKEAFHFFPNFTGAGSCYFIFQLFPAPFQEFTNFPQAGKSAASYHLLPTSSKEKNSQKFTKMLAAGKPFYYQILQKLEK